MSCGQVISDDGQSFSSTVAFIEGLCINDNYKKKILSCTRKIMILFCHIQVILQWLRGFHDYSWVLQKYYLIKKLKTLK